MFFCKTNNTCLATEFDKKNDKRHLFAVTTAAKTFLGPILTVTLYGNMKKQYVALLATQLTHQEGKKS